MPTSFVFISIPPKLSCEYAPPTIPVSLSVVGPITPSTIPINEKWLELIEHN